jgi:serine/threonine protein kinase
MSEESIFTNALARTDPAERRAYLDEVCGEDSTLRRDVEALLALHEADNGFLQRPAPEQLAGRGKPATEALTPDAGRPAPVAELESPPEERTAAGDELAFLAPPAANGQLGRLGHYQVHAVIGKGGFGIVLRAFDERLHRIVAIKVLSPAYAASAEARKRFIREARAAAAVKNEHVVGIYEVQEDAQPPYLVMECIDGISLEDKIKKHGSLGVKEILRVGMQVAEGLAAAHKQGKIHRDIKPANILLENGVERVKITDFGLARAVDDASVTLSGTVAGTPMYMSPEQAEGAPIDHRSDLFSLGTVMYAMCTGHAPFRAGSTHAVLKRVIDASPRPIHEVNSEIPDWLEAMVAKLHAKKADDRFQTAAEVAELLGQHLAHLQQPGIVPNPPITAVPRPYDSPQPHGDTPGDEEEAAFAVQLMPRDIVDVLLVVISWLLWLLPALLCGGLAALADFGEWSALAVLLGVFGWSLLLIGVFFFLGLRAAQRAIVSRRGIELVRDAGPATLIPWSRLRRMVEATRWEVFRRVWLWPGFPPRCSMMGTSALHHFRIEWDGGFYYFAPADPAAFRRAVARHQAHAIQREIEPAGSGDELDSEGVAAPTASRRRRSNLAIPILAGAFVVAAVMLWHSWSADGVVQIEINDPEIHVAVDDLEYVFEGTLRQELAAGTHALSVWRGPMKMDKPAVQFVVYSNEMTSFKIKWSRKSGGELLQVVQGNRLLFELVGQENVEGKIVPQPAGAPGWVSLFNGTDLTAWKVHPHQRTWRVEKGILMGGRPEGHLFSVRSDYEDFHLRFEAKVSDKAGAGIQLRSPYFTERYGPATGFYVPINSNLPRHFRRTGELVVNTVPYMGPSIPCKLGEPPPPDTWFTGEIILRGNRIVLKVDDFTSVDTVLLPPPFARGHLVLSTGEQANIVVQFRKIEIKELRPDPTPPAVELIPLARPDWDRDCWKRENNTLVCPEYPNDVSFLPFDVKLPKEYEVEAVIERLSGNEFIAFHMSAFDKWFQTVLDARPHEGGTGGLGPILGKLPRDGYAIKGMKLQNGVKHTVRWSIRNSTGIQITLDGLTLINYDAGHNDWLDGPRPKNGWPFFVEVHNKASYRIHSLRLKPVNEDPTPR